MHSNSHRWGAPNWTIQLLLVLASIVPAGHATAQTAEFETLGEYMVLAPYVRWFREAGESLTPEQAAAILETQPAYGGDSEWLELGVMQAVVWLAIPITNRTDEEDLVVEFRNPRMSHVDCYIPNDAGGYDVILNGTARPFDERPYHHPMPAFPFTLDQGETTTLLLRLDNVGDFRQRVWLFDAMAFANRMSTAYNSDMISIGFLIVLAIYHFLVFVSLREKGYFFLSLFVVTWMLFYMAGTGTGKMLIWGDFPWLDLRANSIFNCFMNATFILFTMTFLESRRYTPWLFRAGLVGCVIWMLQFVHISLSDNLFRIEAGRYLTLANIAFIAILAIQSIRKGSPRGWFFLFSWVYLLLGGVLLVLLGWYLVSAKWIMGTPIVSTLFTISILIWSFELTGRIKIRAREQRLILERQVKERTQELETALGEVKTLSGMLPICSACKNIRDDTGYWSSVESYVSEHTDAGFTHGICPGCIEKLYPDVAKRMDERNGLEST